MGTEVETPPLADAAPVGVLTRRQLLQRTALAAAGLVVAPAALAACAGGAATPAASQPPTASPSLLPSPAAPTASPSSASVLRVGASFGAFSIDSGSDALAGLTEVNARFTAEVNPVAYTLDPSRPPGADPVGYFAGQPPDVAAFYESESMRYYAEKAGLLAPIDGIWDRVKANYPAPFADVVTHADGHVYGLPFEAQAIVFFYRKSVFAAKGYTVPHTWTDLLALCARMQSDKLPPIALGDRDAWPLLGVFDMFNLRLNGYAFHRQLLAGKAKWTDPRVIKVFETWRKLIAYYPPDFATSTFQDAAAKLARKQAGMFFIESFAVRYLIEADPGIADDLDCFEFPYFGNEWDAERSIEAPAGCWVLPTRSATRATNLQAANAYLEYWSRGATQLVGRSHLPGFVPLALDTDRSQLSGVDRRLFDLIANAGRITQEFECDTRGDFVSGLWYVLLDFAKRPDQDLRTTLAYLQQYWTDLPQPYSEAPAPTPEPS